MNIEVYLQEFAAAWKLLGKAPATVSTYFAYIRDLAGPADARTITLSTVKSWPGASTSNETARHRARAVRAFGKWAAENDGPPWSCSAAVPLASTPPKPQPTVCGDEFADIVGRTRGQRDRTVIELLWSTGMRVSELARVAVEDVDIAGGFISVPRTTTGRPRVVPLSQGALRSRRRLIAGRVEGSLLAMSPHEILLLLRRLGVPPTNACRRR